MRIGVTLKNIALNTAFMSKLINRFRGDFYTKKFGSFNEALYNAGSYDNPDIINIVSYKTKIFKDSIKNNPSNLLKDYQIIQNLFVLSFLSQKKPLKILEIGGACGATFFLINHHIPEFIKTWTIIETNGMVFEAKENFQNDVLQFISVTDFVKDPHPFTGDVLIAQGVLQYLEDPLSFFDTIQQLNFPFIYISRTSFSEDICSPVITQQITRLADHGPGAIPPEGFVDKKVSQPRTIIPFELFKDKILRSYQIVFLFDECNNETVYFPCQKIEVKQMGMLLRRTQNEDSP